MLWKILRPRAWLLAKQLRGASPRERAINLGFLLLVGCCSIYALAALSRRLAGPEGTRFLAVLVPSAAMMLAFFMVVQLADTLYQWFLSPDLAWVLRAPFPFPALFTAKLAECTFTLWLPILAATAVLFTLGMAQSAPLLFFPLAAILILSLAEGITAAGTLIVFLLARLFPPRRLRELLPVGFGLVAILSVLGQQEMLRQISGWAAGVSLMVDALFHPNAMAVLTACMAGAALALTGLAYLCFRLFYSDLFSALQVSTPGLKRASKTADRASFPQQRLFLTTLFPGELHCLIEKEWLGLVRDPRRVTNLVLIPLMMAVMLLPMMGKNSPFCAFSFWLILVYTGLFGVNSAIGTAMTSFTLEGKRFTLLQVTPVRMQAVLAGKFWMSWAPTCVPWVVVLAIIGLVFALPAWHIVALTAATVVGLAASCAVCVGFSAQDADFTAASPNPKMRGPSVRITLVLSLIGQTLAMAVVTGLVLLLARTSDLVANTTGIAQLSPSLTGIATGAGFPLLLVGTAGMLAFGYILRRVWNAAVRRLETWEMV